jgi:hypothetical protein
MKHKARLKALMAAMTPEQLIELADDMHKELRLWRKPHFALHQELAHLVGWKCYQAPEPFSVTVPADGSTIHLPAGGWRIDDPNGVPQWMEGQDYKFDLAWDCALRYRVPNWPGDLYHAMALAETIAYDRPHKFDILFRDSSDGQRIAIFMDRESHTTQFTGTGVTNPLALCQAMIRAIKFGGYFKL